MWVPAAFVALILGGDLALTCCASCVREDITYICTSIPHSFPSHLSSVLIFMKNIGEINSTVLSSDDVASVTSLTMTSGVTAIHPKALYSFRQLMRLNLNKNNLFEISSSWLLQPNLLRNLTLSENLLKVLHEPMLQNFSGLRNLNLSQNVIHTIGAGTFRSQGDLVQLDLSGNKLAFLSPEVSLPLHSIHVLLHHNPWDCSCTAVDFIWLIKDLVSTSRLEREMEVVCATPAHVKGQPVWNMSECLSTSSTSFPPLVGGEQPQSRFPSFLGLLALCVPFFAACLLCGLCKQKLEKKQVKPQVNKGRDFREARQTRKEAERRGSAELRGSSKGKIRAKSAGALLFTGESRQQVSGTGNETSLGQSELSRWYHQDLACGAKTNLSKKQDTVDQGVETQALGPLKDNSRERSLVPENTEKLPYLIIGSDPAQQSSELQGTHQDSKRVNRRALRRTSTWPPTSIQWKEQHVCRSGALNLFPQENLENSTNKCESHVVHFDQTDFILGSGDGDFQVTVATAPAGGDIGSPPGGSYWPVVKTDTPEVTRATEKNDMVHPKEPGSQTQSVEVNISQSPNQHDVLEGFQGQSESDKVGGRRKRNETNRCPSNGCGEENSDHHGGSSFHNIPTRGSPGDKNLLQGNEYAFINLLQEVVQNQGRWTRDRWKQTHLNRQRIKLQNQGP